jgi:hypothetical protein
MPKKKVTTDIVEELKELTQIRDTQPIVTSISHNPNGTIVGVDKEGKLWRYDDWAKLWRAF